MQQPTAEERARLDLDSRKEQQKVNKLKKIIEIKLKDQSPAPKEPRRIA